MNPHTVDPVTMHLTCIECETTYNQPFCPVCVVPTLNDGTYLSVRYDGLDGLTKLDSEQTVSNPTDLFDLFDAPTF